MEYFATCAAAFVASFLTLFSGFGLGTILLPVFALFFPVPLAVALTSVVHFLNNVFKLALLGKHASWPTAVRFGAPAMAASFAGAWVLIWLSGRSPWLGYRLMDHDFVITPVKVVVGAVMVVFASIEFAPKLRSMSFDRRYLPVGGVLSGFFGGLSGHQGAMRSAFLVRCGLTKERFIATGILIAALVDISRLFVYGTHYRTSGIGENWPVVLAATLSAFVGAFLGSRLLPRVTLRMVQVLIAVMLFAIAIGLGAGLI